MSTPCATSPPEPNNNIVRLMTRRTNVTVKTYLLTFSYKCFHDNVARKRYALSFFDITLTKIVSCGHVLRERNMTTCTSHRVGNRIRIDNNKVLKRLNAFLRIDKLNILYAFGLRYSHLHRITSCVDALYRTKDTVKRRFKYYVPTYLWTFKEKVMKT